METQVRARRSLKSNGNEAVDGPGLDLRKLLRALQAVRARKRGTDQQLRGATIAATRTALACHEWARASTLADAVLEIVRAEAIDPRSSAFIGEALLLKAQSERGAGNNPAAVGLAREALMHLRENVGSDHPSTRAALKLAEDPL